MKQVQTKYLLFNFLTGKKGLSVTFLALYPQSSTLHLAVGRSDRFTTAALPLTTKPGSLVKQAIIPWLSKKKVHNCLKFIVTSGYLPQAAKSGLYRLAPAPLQEIMGMGPIVAALLGEELGLDTYLIDPTTPQECYPHALITGTPEFTRKCDGDGFIFKYLSRLQGEGRFIVGHLSETVHIGALSDGRLLDLASSADEGPFALSQAGGLPFDSVLDLCEQLGRRQQILKKINSSGGFRGYLGDVDYSTATKDQGTSDSVLGSEVWQAFVYQIAKEIGASATVLEGSFDAILLGGELLQNKAFAAALEQRIRFLGPVCLYPGDQGLQALLAGAERVFSGDIILNY